MRNPVSRFAYAPTNIGISRSTFERSSTHKTTFNAGYLIPIYVDEYLPGDTFSMDTSVLARMSTPIFPVMDNAYLDIYFFAVPYRIIWDNWKAFMGESPEDPYLNPITYSIPQLKADPSVVDKNVPFGSILDYLGVPAGTTVDSFSALPVRAYCEIWNQWFRDQNLQNAISYSKGDQDEYYISPADISYPSRDDDPEYYVNDSQFGGFPAPVNKYHDYFTSALKEPQKGEPVAIPINGFAPVYAIGDGVGDYQASINYGDTVRTNSPSGSQFPVLTTSGTLGYKSDVSFDYPSSDLKFGNLYANLGATPLSGMDVYATINDLRYAFQIQKLLEADNRYGTRYTEIIKGHFNVDSPDGLLQRPEFLGGKRIHLNIQQVIQTSSTDEVSPQGNAAAYSLTVDRGSSFIKSFTEHGLIMGVACVRTQHTYQQGIERFWNRKDRYDFYFPELANISEQPILNKELWNGSSDEGTSERLGAYDAELSNKYFGYQEPWAEYRMKPNRVSGYFRSTYPTSLDSWHYADFYNSQPYLSSEWIRETSANIDRTLAVQSDIADQILCDFYFDCKTTRPMPIYSIPGLADHH